MELAKLSWPQVDALDRDTPVIIPVAALEQHGRHMPVFTDSMLLGEIVRRAHESFDGDTLLAPLMWLGNSHHHMDFPGTLSADPRVYLDLLTGLMDNFIRHGFRRILILNGHGGNDVPARQVVFELRQRYRDRKDLLLLAATYWHLADPADRLDELRQQEMGHACEWETSMILALTPELVHDHTAVDPVEFGNPFLPASRGWTMSDRSGPGHVGDAAAASADKGEQLLQVFADGVVALLERVTRWDGRSWEG
ncbi:Creatinine amidohydrolase [Stieleria maiorica]|uniref:Creatinine amidohydrolase n=1 Tax=Stieleria maiorica TaxID=2795974 RepID=A0A5B9MIC8_9BACT|nr:creatininase family protein [Stieleria maiorica]QEG01103.1 Creatinine amidohydrolase [Stieleria maiorica]